VSGNYKAPQTVCWRGIQRSTFVVSGHIWIGIMDIYSEKLEGTNVVGTGG